MKIATTKERILQFIEYKGISKQKFFQITGLKRGFLDADKLDTSIPDTFIATIIATFPELGIEWLITGEGSMLKSDTYNSNVSSASVPPPVESSIPLERVYMELLEKEKAELKDAYKEIGNLQAQLETSRKEVVSLELVNSSLREELELAKKNAHFL